MASEYLNLFELAIIMCPCENSSLARFMIRKYYNVINMPIRLINKEVKKFENLEY